MLNRSIVGDEQVNVSPTVAAQAGVDDEGDLESAASKSRSSVKSSAKILLRQQSTYLTLGSQAKS
jgi:hypothetical protein